MVNVGVIGLGMMGLTHLDAYAQRTDARVVAISDRDPGRLAGKVRAAGNVEGQAQGLFDFSGVRKYTDGMDIIRDPEVDAVDICLPTPMHLQFGLAALAAGKHVLCEKPFARTAPDAFTLAAAAERSEGILMVAMCMRFWPGWTWLKKAVDEKTYGKVLAAQFRRVAAHPGGGFYSSGAMSGGGILDLHIHDTDFIHYLFGIPKSVTSFGYSRMTDEIDHVVTRYEYNAVPLVVAEGSWAMSAGFRFEMGYTVNFEQATAVYDVSGKSPLTIYETGQSPRAVELEAGMGYDHEIGYFVGCVQRGERPTKVTPIDAANTIRIIEAESQSAKTGHAVLLD